MRGRFACVLAVTMAVTGASAGTSGAAGDARSARLGHSPLSSRHYGSGLRSGSGYGHTNSLSGLGGHQGSGWYQRGWGGTRDPGWGYRFGPTLGGFGH
jgi:hypothetical protein